MGTWGHDSLGQRETWVRGQRFRAQAQRFGREEAGAEGSTVGGFSEQGQLHLWGRDPCKDIIHSLIMIFSFEGHSEVTLLLEKLTKSRKSLLTR